MNVSNDSSKARATPGYAWGSLPSLATLLAVVVGFAHVAHTQPAVDDANRLYSNRTDLSSARRAAELWTGALIRNPKDFDAAWKLARADYWLGGHAPEKARAAFLEDGVIRGRTAVALAPNRPEGHFWMAQRGCIARRMQPDFHHGLLSCPPSRRQLVAHRRDLAKARALAWRSGGGRRGGPPRGRAGCRSPCAATRSVMKPLIRSAFRAGWRYTTYCVS